MFDFRFSQWRLRRELYSGIWRRVVWKTSTNVKEELSASIFWVEEYAQQANKQAATFCLLPVCLLGLLFDPEDGGSTFHRNVGKRLPDYLGSHSRRHNSSDEHEHRIYFSIVRPFQKHITLLHTCRNECKDIPTVYSILLLYGWQLNCVILWTPYFIQA
jgi:hypothetical protein